MTLLTTFPTVTDDDGTGTTGTPFSNAYNAAVKAAVEAVVHSATNPTVTPEDIIDEMVLARGSMGTLAARLTVSLEDNGALKSQASLVTVSQVKAVVGQPNIAKNPGLLLWSNGDALAPDHFTLSGTGATIARLVTASNLLTGKYALRLTYGSAEVKLTQSVISSLSDIRALRGKYAHVLTRCVAAASNRASLIVDDGVTTTRGGATGNASYHTGGGTEELIWASHPISGSATKLDFYYSVTSGTGDFGAPTVVISDSAIPPSEWVGSVDALGEQHTFGATHKFRAGSSDAAAVMSGRFYTDTTQRANAGTGEDNLSSVSLPANLMDANGKVIRVTVWGSFAANANNKTLKVKLGSTNLFTVGPSAWDNVSWRLTCDIIRTGAAAQYAIDQLVMASTTYQSEVTGDAGTENFATALTLKTTGEATSTGDVTQDGFIVEVIG